MKILLLTLFFLTSFASFAEECDFRLSMPLTFAQPTSTAQTLQMQYTIERRDPSNGPCSYYRLYFGKGLANSYQRKAFNSSGQTYNYNLHQNVNLSGVLKERNDALNATEFIAGNTPDDDVEYTGNFFFALPTLSTQTNQRAGLYYDGVQVSIYRVESNGSVEFEKTQNFNVYINIPTSLNVSLVSEGDPFNISSTSKILDFGSLEENETLGADVIVNSNTPYQLRMSSFNNGKLSNGTSTINYQLSVNNNSVNLSSSKTSPVTIGTGSGPTSTSGTRYNTKVKILAVPDEAQTGLYTDSITITAIAN